MLSSRVLAGLILCVFLSLFSGADAWCERGRLRDVQCRFRSALSFVLQPSVSSEEYRGIQCCARQLQIDSGHVYYPPLRQTETSASRETDVYPNVYDPYQTASPIVIAGKRVFLSASGSYDIITGQQVSDKLDRVNYAYANMYRAARAVGVAQEDFVQLTVLARGTENAEFNDLRVRANNLTLADYGFLQARYPAREFLGVRAIEGANPSDPNSFATVAEFTLSCNGLKLWNLPCDVTQSIATIVTQTAETNDGFTTNRIRAFVKNGTLPNGCPNWVSPPLDQRVNTAWDNIITREGAYLNTQENIGGKIVPRRVFRVQAWCISFNFTKADTFAKIQQHFAAPYPTLRYQQVQNLAQQDIYELGVGYWTGISNLEYNTQTPYPPQGPYSNAVRAGDYIYTTSFGGVNPNTLQLVPLEQRVAQSYSNMLAAARGLGADADDLFHVEALTTSLVRDQPLVDTVSREIFGPNGPFPTRKFEEQPAMLYGETFEVSGIFYSPVCRY